MARLDLAAIIAAAPTMTDDEKRQWDERIQEEMRADYAEMRDQVRCLHAWMLLNPEACAAELRTPAGQAGMAMIHRAIRTMEHMQARAEGRIPDDEVEGSDRE